MSAEVRASARVRGPLTRALLPGYIGRPFPRMTALIGYFDDSKNENIIVVGGYVGHTVDWDESFAPAWDAFVNDPSWPSRIREFKAADCRGGGGQFMHWPAQDRHRCFRRAVEIIRDTMPHENIAGIAVGVALPPEWPVEQRERLLPIGYLICVGLLVTHTVRVCGDVEGVDARNDLHFVFDKQKGLESKAQMMFDSALRFVGLDPEEFDDPDFKHSHKIPGLQAADLIAYETFKEAKKRRVDPDRPVSGALTALLDAHYHYAACVPEETTAFLIERHLAGVPISQDELGELTLYESGKPMRGSDQ
jgi:hypothetical protein